MADSFSNRNIFTTRQFSTKSLKIPNLNNKDITINPLSDVQKLQGEYQKKINTLSNAGYPYDDRNWAEKLLGINEDTKQHAGVLQGTLDILTRPLDVVKSTVFNLSHGTTSKNILNDIWYGISQGKGKNLSGTQVLGLDNVHLDTFTKFIVDAGVNIALDPLTYVPSGVIFSGLKKGVQSVTKLPGINNIITSARTTDFGIAVARLYNNSKNQLGKMFNWMHGTSEESKLQFKNVLADKNHTINDLYESSYRLLKGREGISNDLFNYAKFGELPGDKEFISQWKDNTIGAKLFMDNTIERLGIENPKNIFQKWADKNYNGNLTTAQANLLGFINDPTISQFKDNWNTFITSGNWLNADGTLKNGEQAAQSFWTKINNDWEQLSPNEVQERFSEAAYNDYYLKNPPEEFIKTFLKGLDNGQVILPYNDPQLVRSYLTRFSETTGLDDPLINAVTKRTYKTDALGNRIREINPEEIANAEKIHNEYKEQLKNYTGDSKIEKNRLKKEVDRTRKNLANAKKGKYTFIQENITDKLPVSSYFNITSMKNEGRVALKHLDDQLKKMAQSTNPEILKQYQKLTENSQLNTIRQWLNDAQGNGVRITLKKGVDRNTNYFNANGERIIKPENFKTISKTNPKESITKIIKGQITTGLNGFLKGKYQTEILEQGIMGQVVKDFSTLEVNKENIESVAESITNKILNLKIDMPSNILTPYKGYKSAEYISSLIHINTQMFELIKRFGLDPSYLQQSSILRNVINPQLAEVSRLIELNQGKINNISRDIKPLDRYWGTNPNKVLNSDWLRNAIEINKAVGYKLMQTDPLVSISRTLQILPESLGFSSMLRTAFKNKDIRILTADEKLTYNAKKILPNAKELVDSKQLISRFESIRELIPKDELEEFNSILNNIKGQDALLISSGLNDQLKIMYKAPTTVKSIADYFNKTTNIWKKAAVFTPGYHLRNGVSNFIQPLAVGVPWSKLTPEYAIAQRDIIQVHKITSKIQTQLRDTTLDLSTEQNFQGFIKSFLNDKEYNLYNEYTSLARKGVTSQSRVNGDFWEMMNKTLNTAKTNSKFTKGWDTVINANLKLTQVTDDAIRFATYRIITKNPNIALKIGLKGTPDELAQSLVRITFFDYNALTNFEQNTLRKIFPFYTWSRKNLEFQFRTLINRPEKFTRIWKMFSAWDQAQNYSREEEPDWIKDNMWLPIVQGDKVSFLKVGLPIQDIQEVFNSNGSILSRLNPFYKSIIETMSGNNLYTQQSTNPWESFKSTFWTPVQKLLVQPFDIPLGAIPLGNGQTFGQLFGHPNNYSQKTSMWYQLNFQQLQSQYYYQQINKLNEYKYNLKRQGIQFNNFIKNTIPKNPFSKIRPYKIPKPKF